MSVQDAAQRDFYLHLLANVRDALLKDRTDGDPVWDRWFTQVMGEPACIPGMAADVAAEVATLRDALLAQGPAEAQGQAPPQGVTVSQDVVLVPRERAERLRAYAVHTAATCHVSEAGPPALDARWLAAALGTGKGEGTA